VSGRPYEPITPVGGSAARVTPIDRFKTAGYSAETLAAVESVKDSAGWLGRMSKADGRFMAGVDPALKRELPGSDFAQALAALAMARAARFTGDEKLTAVAHQACLALFTLTKPDATDTTIRVPTLTAERGNKVGFAAALAMAVYDLPNPDAKLVGEADKLVRFLYSRLRSDGSVVCGEATERDVNSPEYAGLCFQTLMASDRVKTEAWKRDAVARGITYYREWFRTKKTIEQCGTMLPAVCDYALRMKSEVANAFAFEMADWLCDQQYSSADVRVLSWVGGIRPASGTEPTIRTAECGEALAAATTLTTQIPDVTRYTRYRTATRTTLTFARTLQFSPVNRNVDHFEQSFRSQYLYGGVYGSPSDGAVRTEHTAMLLKAQLRYLESGAEKSE
jgi:hypothetical protein